MRIVLLSILGALIAGCASPYYVSEKEKSREVPADFDLNNHEYYKTYIPKGLYPKELCDSGFEGYTIVEFDIDASGRTQNHRVIESDAKHEFEKVSILRVSGMKYEPRTIDGESLEVKGVQTKLRFCVEKCRDPKSNCKHRSKACE